MFRQSFSRRSRRWVTAAAVLMVVAVGSGCGGQKVAKQAREQVTQQPLPQAIESAEPQNKGEPRFTDWGWPQPYEKVSDQSIQWLKDKGWWPLQVAWQSPWSGENTLMIVMRDLDLLGKRGIENKFQAFDSGPPINEAVASSKAQVAVGGNFPITSLLDRDIPIRHNGRAGPDLRSRGLHWW